MPLLTRTFARIALVLMLLGLFGADADAQRRRRRRTPTPPPVAEPAETPPEQETEPDVAEVEADVPLASPEPEPEPEPEEAEEETTDLGPLRAELASLMDELVQTRSRIAVLGEHLFQTKVSIRVENRAGDQVLSNFALRLDGAPVFQADGDVGEEGRQAFEGFAAPGPHELTIEAEQRARADDEYRYVQRDRYRFQVVQGKLTEIVITLDDHSDVAEDFADDGEGEYDVRTRVRIATRELRQTE